MAEKTYVNGLFIKEKTFGNGGSILNVDIDFDRFIEELSKHKNANGRVKVSIANRREPDKAGNTHTCYVNDFKPQSQSNSVQKSQHTSSSGAEGDDLPF